MLATLVTMGAAGWYVAVYLARWEWNRAVVAGIIFLAAELGLIGTLVLERLGKLEDRIDERTAPPARPAEPDPRLVAHIHEAAPPSREPFAWLRTGEATNGTRLSVFVPVMLGAGVILSGVAWAVERIARLTGGPVLERRLAGRLDALALPPGGLLGEPASAGSDPFSPGPGPGPRPGAGAGAARP
jgi:hypothetical protein